MSGPEYGLFQPEACARGRPGEKIGRKTGAKIKQINVTQIAAHRFRKSAASVSMARWLAWAEACGKPPSFRTNSSLLNLRASSMLLPFANSVIADPQAIVGTQPFARKQMSTMRALSDLVFSSSGSANLGVSNLGLSNLRLSSRTSPHTGFFNCAVESGSAIAPAFRGF